MARTPKKIPENLTDFAKLANISTESLEQILKKLNAAGIAIKDPEEKLSPSTKVQLLNFFRKEKSIETSIKQTKVSQLSSVGSTKVKITTVTRKSTPLEPEEPLTETATVIEETVPTDSLASDTIPEPDITTVNAIHMDSVDENKKQKTFVKKKKLEPATKSTRRHNQFGASEDETDEPLTTTQSNSSTAMPLQGKKAESSQQSLVKPKKQIARDIWIPEQTTIAELAKKMSIKDDKLITCLKKMDIPLEHYHAPLDQETASLLVEEMGHHPKLLLQNAEELALREALNKQMQGSQTRPPIVTIMGHVDHGKTSLLDYIRRTKVVDKEAGGITQHIGAYYVKHDTGGITFLDTPGHAAFTAMRARGAQLTDIVTIVIAAEDGVMPQTIEAIEHAQAANVPIIIAVNKMDKPGATMENVKKQLSQYNLIAEDWGGETVFVPISAKTGEGVDQLLEALLLQAELSELTAPFKGPGQGIVIESRLDKGQGTVASVVIQKGMLKKGDILLSGTSFGRVRALKNEQGQSIPSATPSLPVEILGLSHPPLAGEEAIVVPNERKAREIAQIRATNTRESQLKRLSNRSLEALKDPFKIHAQKCVNVVIKADVQGSLEALKESLLKLSTEEVVIKPIMSGVGTVNESDVNLAIASQAMIFAFNVTADNLAKRAIQRDKVIVHYYSIIYELLDEAKKIVYGLLEPEIKETILGKATVKEIFKASKTSAVAGCVVVDGTLYTQHNIRIRRKENMIYEGKLHSLRRFKNDVQEVNVGTECGIHIKNYADLRVGDTIESYESTVVPRKL